MYGNEYSAIHQAEVESIKKKIEAKQRNLDAITTVKGYKDPAAKLVKTQEYYINQLENRPSILESRIKEVEDKIALKTTKYNLIIESLDSKIKKYEDDFKRHSDDVEERFSQQKQKLEDDFKRAMSKITTEKETQIKELEVKFDVKTKVLKQEKYMSESKHNSETKKYHSEIESIKNDSETKRLEKEIDALADQILNARSIDNKNKTELVIIEELKALRQQLKDAERQYKEAIEAQEFLAKKEKETDEVREEMWHPWSELKNIGEEERAIVKEAKKNNRLYPEGKPTELPREQDKALNNFKSIISHMSETNHSLPTPSLPAPIIKDTKSPKPVATKPIRPFKMPESVLAVERELEENRAMYKAEGLKAIEEQRKRYREKEARIKQLYFDAEISRDELDEQLRQLRAWEEGQ
jgi:DNA repair exonuclease SbcCD ATPase subunit